MKKTRISLWLAAGLLVGVALVPLAAHAMSNQEYCEQVLGGTYYNDNGTKYCVTSDTPGNNQGGVTKTDTEGQKGSFSSSHDRTSEDCVNNNGGSHC